MRALIRLLPLMPKILVAALIIWVGLSPSAAGQVLMDVQTWSTQNFGGWYVYVTAFYTIVCLALGYLATHGACQGWVKPDEKPEFSMFTWLSMMFGAGIGIGMLTYHAEPIFHFSNNPDVIMGNAHRFER